MRRLLPLAALALAAAPTAMLPAQQLPPATDLWIAELVRDGESWRLESPRNLTGRDGYDNQPAFAAGGARLLYSSMRDGQADVYEIELASGETRRVTTTPESEYSPTPFGDGSRFSTVRVEADGTQRLWSFAYPAGDEARLLAAEQKGVGYHAWLDEKTLALFVLGEPFTLRMLDLASGTASIVAERIGRSLHKVPGTREASYVAPDGDGFAIWAIAAEGGEPRRLAPAPASENRDFAWTPDGALVAAVGAKLFRLRPGADTDWLEFADLAPHGVSDVTRLAVSPEGDRLAFVANR
jgi:Tol biopolymer transport system component